MCPQLCLLTTGTKQSLPDLNGLASLRQSAYKLTMKKIPNSVVLLSALELTFLTLWEEGCCFNKPAAFTSVLNEAPHLETAYLRF